MKVSPTPSASEPTRSEIDALAEPVLIEFGAAWCGYCRAAEPLVAELLASRPQLRHVRIEDGPGRPLGRSFRVKIWPTLIVMHRGSELVRLVRPADLRPIEDALAQFEVAA